MEKVQVNRVAAAHPRENELSKVEVLVVLDGLWSGQVTGGITRTVKNLVAMLGSRYLFRIISWTGEEQPGKLGRHDGVLRGRVALWWGILTGTLLKQAEVIYFNGVFSGALLAGLLGRRFFWREKPQFVIAPRGHLMPAALGKSRLRKKLFLNVLMRARGARQVRWHVTSNIEKIAIQEVVLPAVDSCLVIPNSPPHEVVHWNSHRIRKMPGEARLIFVGDLIPHKGVDFLLEVIAEVKGRVNLDLVGNCLDAQYAAELQVLAKKISKDLLKNVNFHGFLSSDMVFDLIEGAHFLVLSSRSENHGHVIGEALGLHRPVLISDRTPWTSVSGAGAGIVAQFGDARCWNQAVKEIIELDQAGFDGYSRASRMFFDEYVQRVKSANYAALFSPMVSHDD